ncbi:penicillin acylase family protein [Rhabdobacter roseus]|uniref:Penicillin amidase n=1 Tax=Rhabdobacter roseus TaxID=1655419 RepID=A0A840TLX5_9BACT|nr:penicillin acylase family protein [Rhabdobacter roseus]MBB5284591.1 penicillin amidase [Rhabdobacter roseus]
MRRPFVLFLSTLLLPLSLAHAQQTLQMKGLKQPVEVIRDQWGISHIYAQNEHDLFFAQGYVAATDRLFQLELWRRQATGTVAELLGPGELKRDLGTRLFMFRENREQEMAHYHPRGKSIITAYVAGINARVAEMRQDTARLPLEFKLLQTLPGFWTPDVVISRHQGLISNLTSELNIGRQVHLLGEEKTRELNWFHPTYAPEKDPKLTLEKGVEGAALFQDILELYSAFRSPVRFRKEDKSTGEVFDFQEWYATEKEYVGSNNWVLSGQYTQSGFPMLANDPHRTQTTPSLRYWVHLNAPGWNVVGAGEPTLPGVSVGHNEYGAWGITIYSTDNEDLYVYDTNPDNPGQYHYQGKWVSMTTLTDTIPVKGQVPYVATLKYTRHGPVVFEDTQNHKAYAVRAGWREVGCSPYLASLRMNQAKSWEEFREACSYSRLPGLNMVWADRRGHIGWQVVGLAPVRPNWSGLVPVPGDGRFEWAGYLPIKQLPHVANPAKGFWATANNNQITADFPHRNAIGWEWSSPYRAQRIEEVLSAGQRLNLQDFARLQADYLSVPARTLVPMLLAQVAPQTDAEREALDWLRSWDYQLHPDARAATVYAEWENQLKRALYERVVPQNARTHLRALSTKVLLDYVITPPASLGTQPLAQRDELLKSTFQSTLSALASRLGKDRSRWTYGQAANKHITIKHAFSDWVDEGTRQHLDLGPVPRGGYGETVNNTGNTPNQTHGASFRILVDTENWDKTLGINSPGQSADPADPHYRDLFELWAKNQYFPVYFSKEKIKAVADRTWILQP